MKQILDFLRDLGANNNREWFAANKPRYKACEAVFNDFATDLLAAIGDFDPAVRGLTLRDITYRIYRDTRFSHDKTPYKTHFGAYICPGGKKSGNAGYYFHIQPVADGLDGAPANGGANHLLDAGIYMPTPEVLRSVRDEIFDNCAAILKAIKPAEKAGFALDMTNTLKRTPTGFPTGTEWDNYLKLKDLHVTKFVGDDYILAPDPVKRAAANFRKTYEFISIVQRAVRFAHEEQGLI